MKVKHILFATMLLITSTLFAQKGTIKGRITDSKTNHALEFVTVVVQGATQGARTDVEGNFVIQNVEPGFRKLLVSLLGYQTELSPEFQVQGNQISFMDLALVELSFQLSEVTVRQNPNLKKIESPISVLTIGVQEIEKSAGANRDVSKVVQALPGVGATDPNRNDLIVRGGGPSENIFYLDGIEIPVINHFATQGSSGGAIGVINPDFVREISFYTGAFPANRGNALSSVMDIKQKDGSKDKVHTKLSVGASDAALTIDGPLTKKSSFIVSARQSYLQFLFSALGLPFLPTYNDFQVKYKFQPNSHNEITIVGIGAIDDMKLNTDIKNPSESQNYILSYLPTYKQWNYTVGAVYKHFADRYFDTWVLSRNMLRNTNYKYQDNDETKVKLSDYKSDEAENKLRFERSYPDLPIKLLLGAGVKYAHYTNSTKKLLYENNAISSIIYDSELDLFGYQLFAQASKELMKNSLKLSFGISFNGNNYNRNMMNLLNQFSPRISASYALSSKLDFNANIGRYNLQPAYTTLGYRNSSGELVNASEDLKFTQSNQFVAGFDFRPTDNFRFTLEGFMKQYQHYPVSVTDGMSTASKGTDYGQIGDEKIISSGKGRAYGLEFFAKMVNLDKLNISATYTLFRSEFSNVSGNRYYRSSWDTKHLFNLLASYKLPRNYNLALRWRYVGGAPYSPIDSVSYNRQAWNINRKATPDYQQFNSLSLPASHQLDIRIDKEFYFKKWVLNIYTDIQNVYNFKTQGVPKYTNLDQYGLIIPDRNGNSEKQGLRAFDTENGSILPTIGIIIKM